MSTRAQRRKRAMIRAAASNDGPLYFDCAVGPEWIFAAAGDDAAKPPRFAMVAYTGGAMVLNRFDVPVVLDMQGGAIPDSVPILLNHDLTAVVGHGDKVEAGPAVLKVTGVVSGASPAALEVVAASRNGFPWKASVGARPDKLEFVGLGVSAQANGKTFKGPLYVARKWTLGEISFVPVAADGRTSVKIAATAAADNLNRKGPTMDKFHEWLQARGFDPAALDDTQTAAMRADFDAQVKATAKTDPPPVQAAGQPPITAAPAFDVQAVGLLHARHEAMVEAAAAEFSGQIDAAKLTEIKAGGVKAMADLKVKAFAEQWSSERTECALKAAFHDCRYKFKEAALPRGPAIHASNRELSGAVIEAAMCQTLGLPKIEASFDDKTLQAAHSAFRGRLGLQQLVIMAAAANGCQFQPGERLHNGNLRDALRYAMPPFGIQAAGTLSLPRILSNVANKELLQGFMEEDQAWREIAAVKTVGDFKAVTSYRMLDNMEYEELPPGGTMKHGTVSEESYTRQARTYAKMFSLDRTDIINDDMGAFDDIRTRLGRGAARKFNNVFWAKFINNSTFFTSARANYISGATTNLGTDYVGLAAGIKAFDNLRSTAVAPAKTGKRIGGTPTILLVPPELEAVALQIFAPIAAATTANVNIYAGKYRPVKVHQLSDSNFTGYSATAWYLLRDPRIMAAIVVSFLNGMQTPTVESADAEFDQLGILFRGYHDFGCDMAEWLCGVKSKGAA